MPFSTASILLGISVTDIGQLLQLQYFYCMSDVLLVFFSPYEAHVKSLHFRGESYGKIVYDTVSGIKCPI